jgi:rSAM/selenodomain-associated transferase 1
MTNDALILFVRNPQKGQVKTRLAAEVGAEEALRVYKALISHTRNVAMHVQASRFVWFSDFLEASDNWDPAFFEMRVQEGADLGERMLRALCEGLRDHHKVVLTGSDIPGLSPQLIQHAFSRLDDSDVIIGPAKDGGYYLIGMKKLHPEVFRDMIWSHPEVLSETCSRMNRLGVRYELIEPLRDLDTPKDYADLGAEFPNLFTWLASHDSEDILPSSV